MNEQIQCNYQDISPKSFFAISILLLVIAGGLGWARSEIRELWSDEYYSAIMITLPDVVSGAIASEGGNPGLYYILLKSWTSVAGLSAIGMRSMSLLFCLLHIAAIGLLVVTLGLPRVVALVAMGLTALSTLHGYYGSIGRSYALLLFLLTMAMWSFFKAVHTPRPSMWLLHGISLLLAWYTHNLALPFTASFWVAVMMFPQRRRLSVNLFFTHAMAAMLYLPWLGIVWAQAGGDGYNWVRFMWEKTPQLLMIPRTMEVFWIGGQMPDQILIPKVPGEIRILSLATMGVAIFGLFWRDGSSFFPGMRKPGNDAHKGNSFAPQPPITSHGQNGIGDVIRSNQDYDSGHNVRAPIYNCDRRVLGLLLPFFVVPLLFLLIYSNVIRPIYLIGRYDLPAFTPFMICLGIGLCRVYAHLPRKTGKAFLIGYGFLMVILAAFGNQDIHRIYRQNSAEKSTSSKREEVLNQHLSPQDLIVSTGLLTNEIWYMKIINGWNAELITFPIALKDHHGHYNPEEDIRIGTTHLSREADWIFRQIKPPHGRHRVIWFLKASHPFSLQAHHDIIAVFMAAASQWQCHLSYPPGMEKIWQKLGIYPLSFSPRFPADTR